METIVKEINGKAVKIPMPDIVNYMQKLELTQDEAIELWLTDNDYMDNEEVDRLSKQAKDNKITATIHGAESGERKKREVTKKENRATGVKVNSKNNNPYNRETALPTPVPKVKAKSHRSPLGE